jgi:DNA-binding NtrC family response regulator
MRVGGATKIEADVRLVFATLRPLEGEVQSGRFRADLYYRIQGITVRVPPLRERRADIGPLLAQFSEQLSARHGTAPPRFSRAAKAALIAYDWPGNVRELKNTIEMLCVLREGKQVRTRDLPEVIQRAMEAAEPSAQAERTAIDPRQPLERIILQAIRAALLAENGNRSRAAERLGVSVRTIQRYAARGLLAGPEASS